MPSMPTALGLLVAVATFVIAFATGAPGVIDVVLTVTLAGWLVFVVRDLVRAIRNRRAA